LVLKNLIVPLGNYVDTTWNLSFPFNLEQERGLEFRVLNLNNGVMVKNKVANGEPESTEL
jgi:hypothetical protein